MFHSTKAWIWTVVSLALVGVLLNAGCQTEIQVRPLPVAVVGVDRTVVIGSTPIVLDGLGSHVIGLPDTQPDTAEWRIVVSPEGRNGQPAGVIEHQDALRTNMLVSAPGLFVVRLDVTHEGRSGQPAYLNLNAKEVFTPPVAVSGPDQIVDPGQEVTLDGSQSYAPDGGSLSFAWTQLDGAPVALAGAESPYASFTSPGPSGDLTFSLVVTDERRLGSEEASVVVTVRELPPVAVIDAPTNVDETDVVLLGGSRSYDPNEQAIVSHAWQAQWPGGPIIVMDANESAARFQAPRIVGPAPPVRVTLIVTNDVGDVASTTVDIEINDVINDPPVADAGDPQTVGELDVVQLDGSRSSDPNGDLLSYWWSQDSDAGGPAITISGADTPNPTFSAPRVGLNATVSLALVVDDGRGETDRDTVVVTVEHRIVALGIAGQPPESIAAGEPFSIAVEVLDQNGVRETRANDAITIGLVSAPPGGSLGGTLTRTATDGLAVFDGLFIQRAGSGYRIAAGSPLLSSASTINFQVVPGPLHSPISLQATPASIAADGTSQTTISSGQLTDEFGNPATDGTLVTVSTDRGQITATDLSAEPGIQIATSGGTISFALVSGTVTGNALVTAEALIGDALGSIVVHFVPGPPTGVLQLVPDAAVLQADGSASTLVTGGPVTDAYGNTVADGARVTVSAQGGTIVTADADPGQGGIQVLVEDGFFSFEVAAGTVAGDMTVLSETVEGDASGQTTIVLEPGPAVGAIMLTANPSILVADGTSQSVVTSGQIEDQFGNQVADGTPVTLLIDGDASIFTPDFTPADPANHTAGTTNGAITFVVTAGTTAGTVTVSAGSGSATGEVSLVQIAGPAARLSYQSGAGQSGPVAQPLGSPLVVKVVDAHGNAVEGTTVQWSTTSGGGSVSHPAVISDTLGLAQTMASLGTVAGQDAHQFAAAAFDAGGTHLQDSPLAFFATGLPGPAVALTVEGFPATVLAGSIHSLTVKARDEYGNVATGYTGTIAFTSPDDRAALPPPTTFTAADQGTLTFVQAASLRTAGLQSIKVTDGSNFTIFGTHEDILVEPAPAATLSVRGVLSPRSAGQAASVTVEALDPFGNRATAYSGTVSFASSDGAVTLPGSYTFTAVDGGIRSFANALVLRTAGTQSVSATDTLDVSITGSQTEIVVQAAGAHALAFEVHPSSSVAGAPIGSAIQVGIFDEFGNLVLTSTAEITIALGSNPAGGQLFGTAAVAAVGGIATFGDLYIDKAGAGYTLAASSGTLAQGTSDGFDILPGPAASVVAAAWPSAGVTAGQAFTIEAEIHDDFGNLVSGYSANVAAAIQSGPPGAALGGTLLAPASGGIAVFDDLWIDLAGEYTIELSSGLLATGLAGPVSIIPAAPVALFIVDQPAVPVGSGHPFTISAEVVDSHGNRVTDHAGTASIAISSGPAAATLSGSLVATFADGLAVFGGLSLDETGFYVLEVQSAGLTAALTASIEIVEVPATHLAILTQPPATLTAGSVFGLTVEALTAENDRATGFTGMISVEIDSGPPGADVGGTILVQAQEGVATFSDLVLTRVGTYVLRAVSSGLVFALTQEITVGPDIPARLAIVSAAHSVAAGECATPFTVQIQDQFGNPSPVAADTTVRLTSDSPTTVFRANVGCTGGATTSKVIGAGQFTTSLSFVDTTAGSALLGVEADGLLFDSQLQNVSPATPDSIVFVSAPHTVVAGQCSGALVLQSLDAYANPSPAPSDLAIALSAAPAGMHFFIEPSCDPAGAVTSATMAAGQSTATFYFVDTRAGAPIVTATPTGFDPVAQQQEVVAGEARQIVVTTEPTAPVGAAALFTVTAQAQDAHGNLVTSYAAPVSIDISSAPAGGVLSGTLLVSAAAGVATFGDLSLNRVGDYLLQLDSGTLDPGLTGAITVVPGDPAALVLVSAPASLSAGEIFTISAEVHDDQGNLVTDFAGEVWVGFDSAPAGATLFGTTATSAVGGVVAFADLFVDLAGDYRFSLSATGLTPILTDLVPVSPGAADQVVVVAAPATNVAAGEIFSVVAEIQDAYGNLVIDYAGDVVIQVSSGPATGSLSGTLFAAVSGGIATFDNLTLDRVGEWVLGAGSAGLTAGQTGIITVVPGTAAALFVSSAPLSLVAGEVFTLTIEVHDQLGNVATDFVGDVGLALSTAPGGAALNGTQPVAAAAGVAVFGDLSLLIAGDYVIEALSGSLLPASTPTITVAPAEAFRVVIIEEPAAPLAAGEIFSLAVEIQDEYGNRTPGFTGLLAVSIGSGPAGAALMGSLSVSPASGLASFGDLRLELAGDYVLEISSGALLPAATGTITIVPATPAALAIVTQPPSSVVRDVAFTVSAEVVDAYGNRVEGHAGAAAVVIHVGPVGAVLSGTSPVSFVGGVALFDDLSVQELGSYVLEVQSSGLTSVQTAPFAVIDEPATHLFIASQPSTALTAGEIFSLQVVARTAGGALATSFQGEIAVEIQTGPAGAVLGGTKLVSAVDGVADFGDLVLYAAGSYVLEASATGLDPAVTASISVDPDAPAQLAIVSVAHSVAAGDCASPLILQIQDQFGNPSPVAADTTVDLSSSSPTLIFHQNLGCTAGPATNVIIAAGQSQVSLSFLDTTSGLPLVTVQSAGLFSASQIQTITAAAQASLVFTSAPQSITAGGCSGALVLQGLDQYGNVAPATADLVIGLSSDSAGMTFFTAAGCAPASLVTGVTMPAGQATVSFHFSETTMGTPMVIASPVGLDPVSQQQTVLAGEPAAVYLAADPMAPAVGGTSTLTAILLDEHFNPVAGHQVTFSVVTGQGTLATPLTRTTDAGGMATIDYTAHADIETAVIRVELGSDPAIFATVSLTSTAADPTQIVLTFSPTSPQSVGTAFMVVAEAQDDFGNLVTSYAGMVSIAILSGPAGAILLGDTQVQAMGGLIAFLDLAVTHAGTYTLRITDDAGLLGFADTPAFDVTLFADGDGTTTTPYQISNVYQLQAMNDFLDSHFVLVSDVDASDTASWNGGLGFQPIGDLDGPVAGYFTGTFDGQGNTITGLYINRTGQRGYGLFGYLDSNALVQNVCLLDVDISGTEEIGAIAGRVESGNVVVRNVCSTGRIAGSNRRIGGLIGSIKDGTLENGWSRAEMIGGNEIGGALGENDGGTMRLVYSAGPVTGTGAATGGLLGLLRGGGVTQNSFWDVETSGLLTSAAGTGKSSEAMKDVRTFTDVAYSAGLTAPWDFVDDPFDDAAAADIWNLDSSRLINDGYPVLEIIDGLGTGAFALTTLTMLAPVGTGTVSPAAGIHTHTLNVTLTLEAFPGAGHKLDYWVGGMAEPDRLITSVTLDSAKTVQAYFTTLFAGGDGSLASPYQIEDVQDLQAIQNARSAHYVLVADIDASQTSLWNGGAGFVPVSSDGTRFFGTFDGQGKVITGLTINRPAITGVGLFGSAGANSIIENVCLEDVDIIGNREVGAIVGRVRENSAIVRFVCSSGRVEGIGEQVGGIAGRNEGSISNSYSRAWVLAGVRRAGGLVGENSRSIDSCYSTGLVESPAEVGGLLGRGAGTTNSFWDMETSLMLTSAGGTGKTTAQMKDVDTYTVTAPPALQTPWDFAAVWNMDGVIAEGYPFLRVFWQ